jgi:hypothetical protein
MHRALLLVVDDYPSSICLSTFAELIPQSKSKLQCGHNQPAEDTRMCPARTISQSAVRSLQSEVRSLVRNQDRNHNTHSYSSFRPAGS